MQNENTPKIASTIQHVHFEAVNRGSQKKQQHSLLAVSSQFNREWRKSERGRRKKMPQEKVVRERVVKSVQR